MGELFEFFKQGKIKPAVYQSFKMDDFVSAFNLFKDRKVMGKVTLEFKK
jgi:NADPH2:quinone reductase